MAQMLVRVDAKMDGYLYTICNIRDKELFSESDHVWLNHLYKEIALRVLEQWRDK